MTQALGDDWGRVRAEAVFVNQHKAAKKPIITKNSVKFIVKEILMITYRVREPGTDQHTEFYVYSKTEPK